MNIDFRQFETYREQLLAEQFAWHKANVKRELTEDETTAFYAGFNDGWRQLLSALKLHAGLAVT